MTRLALAAKYLFIGVAAIYAADWGVFAYRLAHGTAIGSVKVEQFMKTPLKGKKEQYDYLGPAEVNCSRTLFPQYSASTWNTPCWWLTRHRTRWTEAQSRPTRGELSSLDFH